MTVAVAHQVSSTGARVLQQALREATVRDTELCVLHVVDSIDGDLTEAYRAGISDEIERLLGDAPGVAWSLRLATVSDDAGREIVAMAESVGADLLVIGARRRSPVGKALLGSVTQTVILEADVPVLVVKTPRASVGGE